MFLFRSWSISTVTLEGETERIVPRLDATDAVIGRSYSLGSLMFRRLILAETWSAPSVA